jgi:hypothetical protein
VKKKWEKKKKKKQMDILEASCLGLQSSLTQAEEKELALKTELMTLKEDHSRLGHSMNHIGNHNNDTNKSEEEPSYASGTTTLSQLNAPSAPPFDASLLDSPRSPNSGSSMPPPPSYEDISKDMMIPMDNDMEDLNFDQMEDLKNYSHPHNQHHHGSGGSGGGGGGSSSNSVDGRVEGRKRSSTVATDDCEEFDDPENLYHDTLDDEFHHHHHSNHHDDHDSNQHHDDHSSYMGDTVVANTMTPTLFLNDNDDDNDDEYNHHNISSSHVKNEFSNVNGVHNNDVLDVDNTKELEMEKLRMVVNSLERKIAELEEEKDLLVSKHRLAIDSLQEDHLLEIQSLRDDHELALSKLFDDLKQQSSPIEQGKEEEVGEGGGGERGGGEELEAAHSIQIKQMEDIIEELKTSIIEKEEAMMKLKEEYGSLVKDTDKERRNLMSEISDLSDRSERAEAAMEQLTHRVITTERLHPLRVFLFFSFFFSHIYFMQCVAFVLIWW